MLVEKKWSAIFIIGLLALSFAALAVIHFTAPEELDLSKYQYTPIATDPEQEVQPAWSPDGKSIAYAKKVEGVFQIFIKNLDSPLPSRITNQAQNASQPFWSPDGNLIYFISKRCLYSIGLAGGEAKRILSSAEAATISPDGKTIAYWNNQRDSSTVYIASVNDTVGRRYYPAPFERPVGFTPNFIAFSPDGKRIGLSTWEPAGKGRVFWILPWPDGKNAKPVKMFEGINFSYPPSFSWMPDSRHILLSNDIVLMIGDGETGTVRQLTSAIEERFMSPNISPNGERIVVTVQRENYNIIQLPLDGSRPKLIMASSRDERSMSYTSAGNKAIYISNRSGDNEIWLRMNGVDVRPIITKKDFPNYTGQEIRAATISPDGNRVAFLHSSKECGSRIYVTSTEGGKPTRVLSGDYWEDNCSWSWDGKHLAANILEKESEKLVIAKVGAQERPFFLSRSDSIRGWVNWSPDNKWIACGIGKNIVLISSDGKTRRIIASPEVADADQYFLVWSRDGGTIFVAGSAGRGARLHAVDVKTGRSKKIAEYEDDIMFSTPSTFTLFGCLAPDGKSIVTTAVDYKSDIWILEGLPQK
ncbi:MAG: hypothetical protein NTV54_09560 [Ignavibacteriales bacterium]|nr:hypothetical protein [Ignavibacteriales bacterium]